ncbi:dienelactone hydrolase family protein [Aestuariimicrobium soli]|uniref:dienelactone hydrolase family protein n=1 Tax=Aestuariimicrobium soli TaxID=2035834 RepID=UPI003EC12C94
MAQSITIDVDGTPVEAWLSTPTPAGPGVLLFMDALGLRDQIGRMCDRIASWGFTVLAPNVFWRSGTAAETSPTTDLTIPENRAAFFEHAGPRVQSLTADLAEHDIPFYLAALREASDGDEVGVTGYCMGARLAVRAAGIDPQVVAVGGFHGGGLVTDAPDSPHHALAHARAEFVFGHADQDRSMTPDNVADLGRALADAGLTASNEIYPGSPHGYTMSDASSYDEAGAERHYRELEHLLRRTLTPASPTAAPTSGH